MTMGNQFFPRPPNFAAGVMSRSPRIPPSACSPRVPPCCCGRLRRFCFGESTTFIPCFASRATGRCRVTSHEYMGSRGYKNTENVGQYRLIVVLHFLQSVLAQWVLHLDPPNPRSNSNSGSGKGAGHGKAERWSRFVTG